MTASPRQIARLIEVLDAAFQAEQAQLGQIGRRIDTLRDRLTALQPKPFDPGVSGIAAAAMVEADMRWRAWAETRRKTLNADLAKLMREREERRAKLTLAFGKLQAARSMRANLLDEAARKARRG